MQSEWQGKPYNPISEFYRNTFGSKVVKVPVALAQDCPNRMGLKGMKTCIFCDVHGSFAYPENAAEDLRRQIEMHRARVQKRTNSQKFLIYFQAYTTTFTQVKRLREAFDIALSYPDVVGIVVGTRPDCLSHAVLRMWNEYAERTFIAVEVGVQSFNDRQLLWMERGHSRDQAIRGVQRIAEACPKVNLGIHLIFGWPGESKSEIIEAARIANSLPIQNVKLHNLHVLKNTPLEEIYQRGEYIPLTREEYASCIGVFLQHLRPDLAVHRLAALASRWDELVAPPWARQRMENFQFFLDYFAENEIFQGQHFRDELSIHAAEI